MVAKRKLQHRNSRAFVLAAILIFSLGAILMLMSVMPLVDQIIRLESYGRNTTELRAAADIGIDYAIEQLNEFAAANPGFNSPLINSGVIALPLTYSSGLKGGAVSVQIKAITAPEWSALPNLSSIYSSDLQASLGNYLVVESKAKRGLLVRTVRVFLEPTCNITPAEISQPGSTSYFKDPLSAAADIKRVTQPSLEIRSADGTVFPVKASNTVTTNIYGDINPLPNQSMNFASIPSPGVTSPLPSSSGSVNSYQAGSYLASNLNFDSSNLAQVKAEVTAPVKIFVQDGVLADGSLPPTVVNINASALKNNSTPQNLQFWYSGNRNIQINLDENFNGLIYAPKSTLTISGTGNFAGAIVASTINLENTGKMTISTNLTDQTSPQVGSNGLLYSSKGNAPVVHGYKAVSWQDLSAAP